MLDEPPPPANYERELFDPPPARGQGRDEKSVKLDYSLYLLADRWKAKLRLMFPGKKITVRSIFNRGIFLVCEELKDRYGPLD